MGTTGQNYFCHAICIDANAPVLSTTKHSEINVSAKEEFHCEIGSQYKKKNIYI